MAETGQEVAVKVLRPGIVKAFRKDIDAFYLAASMIQMLFHVPSSAPARCDRAFRRCCLGELIYG